MYELAELMTHSLTGAESAGGPLGSGRSLRSSCDHFSWVLSEVMLGPLQTYGHTIWVKADLSQKRSPKDRRPKIRQKLCSEQPTTSWVETRCHDGLAENLTVYLHWFKWGIKHLNSLQISSSVKKYINHLCSLQWFHWMHLWWYDIHLIWWRFSYRVYKGLRLKNFYLLNSFLDPSERAVFYPVIARSTRIRVERDERLRHADIQINTWFDVLRCK